MANVLEVRDLEVLLSKNPVLNGVSFSIADRGHIVGLFGQNGAGNTTLIRTVCGLINRFTGSVAPRGSAVAYVPDAPFLDRGAKIGDLIRLCSELFDDFDADITRQILSELGLGLEMKVAVASKGMSEQVHLAMILGRRSPLYVLDEPLASVDPLTRDRILSVIRRYRQPG